MTHQIQDKSLLGEGKEEEISNLAVLFYFLKLMIG